VAEEVDNVIPFKRYEPYTQYLARWSTRCKEIMAANKGPVGATMVGTELAAELRKIKAGHYTTVRAHIAAKAITRILNEYTNTSTRGKKKDL
jgi:hypothetical protein